MAMALKAVHGRMLEDYVAVLRRRWLVVFLSVCIAVGAGYAYLQVAPKTYVSSAKVLVQRTSADPVAEDSRTTDSVNLDTEAQLVKSVPVAELAEQDLNTSLTPVQLARRVTVLVPANTTVLEISYTARTPELAQEGAQAFADAYLQYREEAAEETVQEQVASLEDEIDATSDELRDVNAAIEVASSEQIRASLRARREALNTRLTALNSELSTMRGAVIQPGLVINEAQAPNKPRDPNPMLVLPSAVFLGLLIGLVLALWRERRDQRIHSVADIDRVFGLTPLADLRVTVGAGTGQRGLHYNVKALYHSVRANGPDTAEVVLVVAPDSVRVASGVSRALGVSAARSGATTTYLAGETDIDGAAVRQQPSGGVLRTLHYDDVNLVNDGEINAERLQTQIRGLRADNDFVVLGLPSNDPTVDLPMLCRHADVILVLVHLGQATRTSVGETLRSLKTSGARTVFIVSVDMRRRGRGIRHASIMDEPVGAEDAKPAAASTGGDSKGGSAPGQQKRPAPTATNPSGNDPSGQRPSGKGSPAGNSPARSR